MFNVKTMNGNIIPVDFDIITDEELRELENSIATYRIRKKELDIRKSIDTIIDCIEAEIKRCPNLKDRTAIITDEEECLDWFDVLSKIKDAYF